MSEERWEKFAGICLPHANQIETDLHLLHPRDAGRSGRTRQNRPVFRTLRDFRLNSRRVRAVQQFVQFEQKTPRLLAHPVLTPNGQRLKRMNRTRILPGFNFREMNPRRRYRDQIDFAEAGVVIVSQQNVAAFFQEGQGNTFARVTKFFIAAAFQISFSRSMPDSRASRALMMYRSDSLMRSENTSPVNGRPLWSRSIRTMGRSGLSVREEMTIPIC